MLKYDIRADNLGEDRLNLDLFSISTHDYYVERDKVEVRNIYSNNVTLYNGATVSVVTTIYKDDGYENRTPISFNDDVTVVTCDNVEKSFSFISNKYIEISLDSISIEVENNVLYLHFLFNQWHYFTKLDDYGIVLYLDFSTSETSKKRIVFTECQYVTNNEIKWRYDAGLDNINEFMCSVFRNDAYEFIGYGEYNEDVDEKYVLVEEIPQTACFIDELYLKKKVTYSEEPECWRYELYEKSCNEGTLFGITVNREDFRFKKVSQTEEYFLTPLVSLPVPISLKTGNNTYQEQNLNDNFVQTSIENAKNKSPEMEKFVYHPVFRVGGGYQAIHRIKFNLHFREREKDGWIVKPDGYWNGMDANGLHGVTGDNNGFQFFSYRDTDDPQGRQSDLLTYLGFTNNDVKYQKSRLKKSFLRLSFYDSKNRANQNLLCYSTLFLDSGNLFAKMMRGAKKTNGYVVSDQITSIKYDDTKVDREPCPPLITTNTPNEEVEEYRLSSQIVVSDRYSSSCSEGFYLYLWADNDNGRLPADIYMRVEFNHAGYGRVIPFTMPYLKAGNSSRIYTFQEIYNAWFPTDPTQKAGWGILKNEDFSYIHFKYVYDDEHKQHVYYLDGDTYGMGSYNDNTPDELELNLYEAKINFE